MRRKRLSARAADDERFLRIKQLTRRWSVHRSTIWRWVKNGELPKPRRLGPKVVAWPISTVEKFEQRHAGKELR